MERPTAAAMTRQISSRGIESARLATSSEHSDRTLFFCVRAISNSISLILLVCSMCVDGVLAGSWEREQLQLQFSGESSERRRCTRKV